MERETLMTLILTYIVKVMTLSNLQQVLATRCSVKVSNKKVWKIIFAKNNIKNYPHTLSCLRNDFPRELSSTSLSFAKRRRTFHANGVSSPSFC